MTVKHRPEMIPKPYRNKGMPCTLSAIPPDFETRLTGQKIPENDTEKIQMDVFAEVLKIDSQAHLVLLGDGELMDEIKRKTADLDISEHVTFVGNVGNANEWYQAFDCFVLPSIWEGLPVVGVEAQAADLPCVFSSAITREIGLSQRAKFVPLTESVSVWAKTLCDALQQNERNDNTKLITEHHYNIAFEAKKLQERYLQLAGEVK